MKKGTRGGSSKHACTHARRRPRRGVEETESKDYFGIGGDKPDQHRACVRKRERESEERLSETEKEGE